MTVEFHAWPPRTVGGQHVRASAGVLALDVETGIAVYIGTERSQHGNRQRAEERLLLMLSAEDRRVAYYAAIMRCVDRYRTMAATHDDLKLFLNEFTTGVPLVKLSRWLGYVQGVLIARGETTVEAERDWTQPLFRPLDVLRPEQMRDDWSRFVHMWFVIGCDVDDRRELGALSWLDGISEYRFSRKVGEYAKDSHTDSDG